MWRIIDVGSEAGHLSSCILNASITLILLDFSSTLKVDLYNFPSQTAASRSLTDLRNSTQCP
jgi:hypothetical protein